MTKQGYEHYFQQDILTASPQKIVYMLYDRAIFQLKEAIKAIDNNDIEKRFNCNKKAFEIIAHMWQTLDMEQGGDVSANLEKLFSYALRRLPDVDIKNDPEPAQEVINLLQPICDSWKELADNPEMAQKAAQEAVVDNQAQKATSAPSSSSAAESESNSEDTPRSNTEEEKTSSDGQPTSSTLSISA